MNRPITRLFLLVLAMFGALIAYTSRWTVFDASALQGSKLNARTLLETQDIQRGTIYADNGTVIADSTRQAGGTYVRHYPYGSLFANPVGFAFPNNGAAELEEYWSGVLSGTPLDHQSVLDQLEGRQTAGDSIYTSLDPAAQRVALADLAAQHLGGAVVAMVPSTGAIKVFASYPTYDPNRIPSGHAGDQFDRVTEAQDFPGSAQKVVTASAALDAGKFTPDSLVDGSSPQTFEGIPLSNDGGLSYGEVSLTEALTQSINTVFANVAQDIGPAILQRYMLRFGYYRDPPIDLPSDELTPSGVLQGGKLDLPSSGLVDVPLVGIGEGHLVVTPLQMVMVAAAVANGGKLMTPHIAERLVNADGITVRRIAPALYADVMKPATASAVTTMMEDVVHDGTAERALAGFDITVAGKTGTAQINDSPDAPNDAWFIAFAPGHDIAVAAVVERTSEYGADAAAPIVRDVIQSLVQGSG